MNRDEEWTGSDRRAYELVKNKSRMEQDEIAAELERQAVNNAKL